MVLSIGHQSHSAFTMKSSTLFSVVLLLTLGTLASWTGAAFRTDTIKAGACPARKPAMCLRYEKPECQNDWHCPGLQRCCRDYCSVRCLDPVAISNPVEKKAGQCPVVKAECLMLNPPNYCTTDGQCEGNNKCCKGICGKACIPPV